MTIRNPKSKIENSVRVSVKKVMIAPDKCDGCGECEKACAARFGGRPYRLPRRERREPPGDNTCAGKAGHVPQSRIRVERVTVEPAAEHATARAASTRSHAASPDTARGRPPRRDAFIPLLCFHCDDAPCVEVCISGAMRRGARTGLVLPDEKQCVGCWSCVMVCPFGVVKPDFKNHRSSKCDGCAGRRVPECVRSCKPQALLFLTPDAFSSMRAHSRLAARAGMYRHGPSTR